MTGEIKYCFLFFTFLNYLKRCLKQLGDAKECVCASDNINSNVNIFLKIFVLLYADEMANL